MSYKLHTQNEFLRLNLHATNSNAASPNCSIKCYKDLSQFENHIQILKKMLQS